ncbi:hypothetical protein Droror1_Dr00024138 [Drosera rotundifolia]
MESKQACSANSSPVVVPKPEVLTVPDPDLHEFDDGGKQECFSVDQLYAIYEETVPVVSKEETISSGKAENSAFLEKLKKKGYEVLFMVDAFDQYAARRLKNCEDEKLLSATKDEKYPVSAETVIAEIVSKHIDDTQSVWELKANEARLD